MNIYIEIERRQRDGNDEEKFYGLTHHSAKT